jgi:hypothetical protein
LTSAGTILLKTLHDETPADPYFSALYHRFSALDSGQDGTLELLKNIPREIGDFGWGSAPPEVFTVLTVAVLEGK